MRRLLKLSLFFSLTIMIYATPKNEFKVIESKNMLQEGSQLIDINNATESDMLKAGIAKSYVEKIIQYRDVTGGFQKLSDLKNISGIGKKTYDKLKKSFKIDTIPDLKPLYINDADDTMLKYYGFSKKEIQDIRKAQKKGVFRSNVDLEGVISDRTYQRLKDIIVY